MRSACFDTIPFLFLSGILLISYSIIFHILFNNSYIEDEGQDFTTIPETFETLLYASLGNFEKEMLNPSNDFITVWRSILFNVFLFISAIGYLSLLVAILVDTYDRVRLDEKALLTRCRARIVHSILKASSFRKRLREWRPWSSKEKQSRANSLLRRRQYFHFLIPEELSEFKSDAAWAGKILTMERTTKTELQKMAKSCREQTTCLSEEITTLREQFQEIAIQLRANSDQISALERRMEGAYLKMLQKLDQLTPSDFQGQPDDAASLG